MSVYDRMGGTDAALIKNSREIRLETAKAQDIVVTLDKCGIPFSARFNDSEIVITFDGSFKEQVDEVMHKALSGSGEELIRELKEKSGDDRLERILPEIADILHTTVGTLRSRPLDIQENLCKAYLDFYHCDTYTLQRELDRIITVNGRTYEDIGEHEHKAFRSGGTHDNNRETAKAYITREMQRKAADELIARQKENEIEEAHARTR